MANISIDQLSAEIVKAVQEYTEDVTESIDIKVSQVANQVLKEVRRTAPRDTGEYAKSFAKADRSTPGKKRYIIHNRKHWRLIHLLEFGHATVKGGRVAARPHLRVAYDKYAGDLPHQIKTIIRKGGGGD